MIKPKTERADSRFLLLAALALSLEAPIFLVFAGRAAIPGWLAAALHAAAAATMFLAPKREKGYFRPTRHWGEPLGLLALLLPGAGCLLGICLYLLHPDAHQDKESYRFEDDEPENLNWLAGQGAAADLREQLADARDVIPAADALLGRDPALKRGAIEVLAQIRSREAVKWLLRARTDDDPEIRFYATTAVTRIKRDFDAETGAAESEVHAHPHDLSKQLALDGIRYQYARTGLLEPATAELLLRQCRGRLAGFADRDLDALTLLYLVERELDLDAALRSLERLANKDAARRARWIRDTVDLAFELRRYGEVKRLSRDFGEQLMTAGPDIGRRELADWRAATLWWAHD